MDVYTFRKMYIGKSGVYQVKNLKSNKSIIGSSINLGIRVSEAYYFEPLNGRCHNKEFLKDFDKDSLDFILLEEVQDSKNLKRIEEDYIHKTPNLYNKICTVGIKMNDYHKGIFWTHVDKKSNDECWLWVGAKYNGANKPYGIVVCNQKRYTAHRIAYFIINGEFDWSLSICHKCDNTLCVNPNHLFLGSHHENMKDRANKNRSARITKEMADDIRNRSNKTSYDDLLRYFIDTYKFKIAYTTIGDILHNRIKPNINWIPKKRSKKLSNETINQIRNDFKNGETRYSLAEKFKISHSMICLIINNKSYKI